jgi:hypothetical protein
MLITSGEYPPDWDDKAREIKEAAGWKCERCGIPHNLAENRMMTVHHLDGNKTNCEPYNLACLCRPCHLKMHHLFCPDQLWLFPPPAWLLLHIQASPWKCAG